MATKDAKLKIIIDAQDNTKGTLRNLSSQMGTAERSASSMTTTLRRFALATAAAATSAAGLLGYGVKIAADLQTAHVGLETLLGSAEAADKTIERLKVEAARTPFELPGLTQATQLLAAVTKDGDRSIDILLDVGEALAAMGKGQAELDRIIVNLQQVAAVGHAAMIDIKQFAFAGIPIFEMLQQETGLAGEALSDFISDGGVTFELLTRMFDKANDEGGRFFNAFKNQTGTFNQSLANLKDSFGLFLADFAEATGVFDGLTIAMQNASSFLQNYKTHIANLRAAVIELFTTIDEKTGLITLFRDVWANLVFMWQTELKPALLELWQTLQPLKPFLEAMGQVLGATLVAAITLLVMTLGTLAAGLIRITTIVVKISDIAYGIFVPALNAIIDAVASVITWVDKLIDKFQKAISLAQRIGKGVGGVVKGVGSVIGVNDAVISPEGKVISTHPDDYLIATKNPASLAGGGVTVNINGGTYLSEDAAEKLGDLIMRRLQLSNPL